MSNFWQFDRATGFLLPPSLDEWLPERHLARFVVEVAPAYDVAEITALAGATVAWEYVCLIGRAVANGRMRLP